MTGSSPLRQDEIDLYGDLIDFAERRALVGRPDDEFLVAFVGNDGDLTHGGLGGSRAVSMRTLRRFSKSGLIEILRETDAAMSFGLADDHRDRFARLRSPTKVEAAVFISVAESRKLELARPFKALLAESGVRGFIVSDEPLPEGAFTPEQKVDAYLDRADAVVVFATADIKEGESTYSRLNIADEIARARRMERLRDRICVLKEHGVILPSNINPAYDQLDAQYPDEAFRSALRQLAEWGLPVVHHDRLLEDRQVAGSPPMRAPLRVDGGIVAVDFDALLERAKALIPVGRNLGHGPALGVIVVNGPRQAVLRPAQLEDPALARLIVQEALFGEAAIFDPTEGTKTAMSGDRLVVEQSSDRVSVDAEGALVIVRSLARRNAARSGFGAVIEDDVRDDLERGLRFAGDVLDMIDRGGVLTDFVAIAVLLGAGYGAWRTRAEEAASPNAMTMNITNGDQAVATLGPVGQPRTALAKGAKNLAADLTVLLRREAVRSP